MKAQSVILNLITLAVMAAVTGCASTGYQQADKTGQGIAEFRNEVVNIKASVAGAMASLANTRATAASDPRKAFNAFSAAVDRVVDGRARAQKRAAAVKAQGAAYFKQWETELAAINNPEIRQLAQDRKAKLEETFDKIAPLLEQAKDDFDPFLSDLKDVRSLLSADLTVTGVDAAGGIIKKTRQSGAKVQDSLEELLDEMNTIAATLTAAKVEKK